MSAANQAQGPSAQTAFLLQCFSSIVGTMVGEAIGDTLVEKLVAGLLLCAIGAILAAPGGHHRRRVVAIALFLALLESLRRAAGALASSGRERASDAHAGAFTPASWTSVVGATMIGLALGSAGTATYGGWSSESSSATVVVPVVTGKSLAEARSLLEGSDLTAVVARTRSASVKRGFAIRTAPPGRTEVRAGSSITLYVSSGGPAARVSVPAVRGVPERVARSLLEDAGLRVTASEAASNQIARGLATGTSPPADTRVATRSPVTLFVSSGPPPDERIAIPDVADLSERAALRRLRGAALDPVARPTASEDVPKGRAIRTVPAAGSRVERGAGVRLVVSSGPEVERVEIPRLTGETLEAASARLDELALEVESEIDDSSEPKGTVIRSRPAAGTSVPVGTLVRLAVSSGTLVRVPPVVRESIGDATRALKIAGLTWTTTDVVSSEPAGTVTKTDPAAGTEVARDSNVDVFVSCGSQETCQAEP